jgi:hypothetical protein
MNIVHEDNQKKGRFYIELNNETIAEMTYVWTGTDKIIVDHTEVDEQLKGQNIGKKLFSEMIKWVREKQIKVIPLCPFVKSVFSKTNEYNDVLFS